MNNSDALENQVIEYGNTDPILKPFLESKPQTFYMVVEQDMYVLFIQHTSMWVITPYWLTVWVSRPSVAMLPTLLAFLKGPGSNIDWTLSSCGVETFFNPED